MTDEQISTPGRRMRVLRSALGMTQETLARKLHTKQAAVSQWENDKWLPTRPMQFAIAEALNTSRVWLFGTDEDQLVRRMTKAS